MRGLALARESASLPRCEALRKGLLLPEVTLRILDSPNCLAPLYFKPRNVRRMSRLENRTSIHQPRSARPQNVPAPQARHADSAQPSWRMTRPQPGHTMMQHARVTPVRQALISVPHRFRQSECLRAWSATLCLVHPPSYKLAWANHRSARCLLTLPACSWWIASAATRPPTTRRLRITNAG